MVFPSAWDRSELGRDTWRDRYRIVSFGAQPLGLPRALGLGCLRPRRLTERLVRLAARERADGILSTDDYLGSAVAALAARRLGLPGPDPAVLLRLQHKQLSRQIQLDIVPEAVPRFWFLHPSGAPDGAGPPEYPCFVKPYRGTFSLLAAEANGPPELRVQARLRPFERQGLQVLGWPYLRLLRREGGVPAARTGLLAEEILRGDQVNVDGFIDRGRARILGVVDARFYPGTRAFERFSYPSRLAADVQERMTDVARRLIEGSGLGHGAFSVEMAHDPATGAVRVIEVNPRLSAQFADLYEKVDGANAYEAALALATGERPAAPPHRQGRSRCAASFVLRRFEGHRVAAVPGPRAVAAIERDIPGTRIHIDAHVGQRLALHLRAFGSFRYAVYNLGADSEPALEALGARVRERLPFRFA